MSSLSTHLLNSRNMAVQHNSHSGNPTQMVYSGPMSYNAAAHGSPNLAFPSTPFPALLDPSALPPEPTYYDISVATHKQIATLQAKLDQKLGPEYISQRPGPGGGPKLTYAEGWKIINLANEVFGFNGWSSSICSLSVDYLDGVDDGRKWNCGVTAVVRVTLKDGVYHEDIGYGVAENIRGKGTALDKCKKEAVTDGLKRALRNFGNLLGNCLYDKQYTQEIVKIKVQPPKFDASKLHRRPEFEEGSSRGAKTESCSNVPRDAGYRGSTAANNTTAPQRPSNNAGNQAVKCKDEPSTPTIAKAVITPNAVKTYTKLEDTKPAQDVNRESNNSTDQEEASYFNSEDDAYFMQLDMGGEVSLEEDRPLHIETAYDNSPPIDNAKPPSLPLPNLLNENAKPPLTCDYENKSLQPEMRKPPSAPLSANLRQSEKGQQANCVIKPELQTARNPNSLGEFHFPPALGQPRSAMPMPVTPHVTGVKRGVDSISDPASKYRREAVIQNAMRAHAKSIDTEGKYREPLVPLPVNRENDVKRMRR